MKTSQVSRANGTTHNHQSSVLKEGASLWQLVNVLDGITSKGTEVVCDLCHVMRQVDEDFTSL